MTLNVNARIILKCTLRAAHLTYVGLRWLSDSTIRIGVARGGRGGVGWRA